MERGENRVIEVPILEDPESASVDERDEHLGLIEEASQHLEIERARTLGVSDASGDHEVFGYPSTVAYLKHRFRIGAGRAHRYAKTARIGQRFKATLQAWRHRFINSDQAEMLFRAAEKLPDKYPEAESFLLEIVGDDVAETKRLIDYWTQTVDRDPLDGDAQSERRRFDWVRKANGIVEGDFALPQLAGETLITAIEAVMPPPAEDDQRTPTQRRADALEDLSRSYLEGTESSEVGAEKPHLNIHVDINALDGNPGGLHETETGQVLNVETIRQLACDSSVSRIVWNPESEIIDVGRRTRVIPAATRRAVIARDRHCTHPGCDRNPRWCDVHHIQHWADGGETNIDNLTLLCRHHHSLIHSEETDLVGAGRPI